MTREALLAICKLVVSSRWQDLAMFVDGSGRVIVWSGDEGVARRLVDDRGQLLGSSGNTTHAHALLLELEAQKPRWQTEPGMRHHTFAGAVALSTTLVTAHRGDDGDERARHLAELLRDALRERLRPEDLLVRVHALVRSQPGRLPS